MISQELAALRSALEASLDRIATLEKQQQLLKELSQADTGRVFDGVVENYLQVPYTDPQLVHTADAAEWLSLHDVTQAAQLTTHACRAANGRRGGLHAEDFIEGRPAASKGTAEAQITWRL